ncbi:MULTISPECIES: hypothetical protein [unclassified Microcoleus]|uniref:hypothetical protein n=1 Tax=unclassified Microcoleus TaxID=2642155 RepID=UPI001DE3E3C8|nr:MULTISPECIES: hypothetical protein [unclassified Microcoleus]MCC3442028.1 hypothetical protein [Microcoleus sp. PH2017_03_ELD_O_A]MCC3467721.1 hypothetical protein [Microcoleus sp. PH2017_06_SFM_O_A]MCC3502722.1 hypothetical protein [Microcoleus sp. PH2017_19_SFW_U_A]TAF88714.1 MAG: hypothetical protein EAZ49_15555 [Oscillatoriales cyanobacterium]MCC3415654.1 hypothetical protein [Microcoleus sp. PH2017_02_FOX_O_A]
MTGYSFEVWGGQDAHPTTLVVAQASCLLLLGRARCPPHNSCGGTGILPVAFGGGQDAHPTTLVVAQASCLWLLGIQLGKVE